jgi:hypothetical protein
LLRPLGVQLIPAYFVRGSLLAGMNNGPRRIAGRERRS